MCKGFADPLHPTLLDFVSFAFLFSVECWTRCRNSAYFQACPVSRQHLCSSQWWRRRPRSDPGTARLLALVCQRPIGLCRAWSSSIITQPSREALACASQSSFCYKFMHQTSNKRYGFCAKYLVRFSIPRTSATLACVNITSGSLGSSTLFE